MFIRHTLMLTMVLASGWCADAADTYRNPVIDENLADPAVIFHKGTYYLYATGAVEGDNGYRVYTSKDLVGWTCGPVVLPVTPTQPSTSPVFTRWPT